MISDATHKAAQRLPPRDPKGGRPSHDIAARLGPHILETALREFIRGGVDSTSVEAISAAANISKRTIYSRFGSKLALLVAAIEHGLAQHIDPIAASVPRGSVRSKVVYVARKMLDMSLRPEVVGIESLIDWLTRHRPDLVETTPSIGTQIAIDVIQSILEDLEPGNRESRDMPFLACFLFDALVTIPRHRILFRHDLRNTPRAKSDYIKRALDLMTSDVPLLAENSNKV